MPERHVSDRGAAADGDKRFDGESVRRILERAAAEQYRLDHELTDTYSLEELEEMAAEAGISTEALRTAIKRSQQPPDVASIGATQRKRPAVWHKRWLGTRYRAVKGTALLTIAGVAVVGSVLAFPVVAQVLFWTTLVLSVLIVLGASPF
jgi:hypothetical protein